MCFSRAASSAGSDKVGDAREGDRGAYITSSCGSRECGGDGEAPPSADTHAEPDAPKQERTVPLWKETSCSFPSFYFPVSETDSLSYRSGTNVVARQWDPFPSLDEIRACFNTAH